MLTIYNLCMCLGAPCNKLRPYCRSYYAEKEDYDIWLVSWVCPVRFGDRVSEALFHFLDTWEQVTSLKLAYESSHTWNKELSASGETNRCFVIINFHLQSSFFFVFYCKMVVETLCLYGINYQLWGKCVLRYHAACENAWINTVCGGLNASWK